MAWLGSGVGVCGLQEAFEQGWGGVSYEVSFIE